MKKFEEPTFMVVEMEGMDVIATSGGNETPKESNTTTIGYTDASKGENSIW